MIRGSETPLVLIAFNRPNLLRQQLEIVRESFNGPIYAIVDGPRADRPGENEQVAEVVSLVQGLRKDYNVQINQSFENLGCYKRIKTGLDWVFSQVDRAIILEDDCIPSPQFFAFASEMLDRYSADERVYSIAGTNLFPRYDHQSDSYFFSRYPNSWGWATWSRAWNNFIDSEKEWKMVRASRNFESLFSKKRGFIYWKKIFDLTYSGKIDSWFYRWMLSCWMQNASSIYPAQNLIVNLGDDDKATNTKNYVLLMKKHGKLNHKLSRPACHIINHEFDELLEDNVYSKKISARLVWLRSRGLKIIVNYIKRSWRVCIG